MPRLLLYISADSHSLYRWERSGLQLLQRFKPEDIARLRSTRCDAVLMGEVFATSLDPAATLAGLAAAARGSA